MQEILLKTICAARFQMSAFNFPVFPHLLVATCADSLNFTKQSYNKNTEHKRKQRENDKIGIFKCVHGKFPIDCPGIRILSNPRCQSFS